MPLSRNQRIRPDSPEVQEARKSDAYRNWVISEESDPEAALGEAVRSLRLARGWSQTDLAKRLADVGRPMHQTTVAKLEAGERPIRLNEVVLLAGVLDVVLVELLTAARLTAGTDVERSLAERAFAQAKAQVRAVEDRLATARATVAALEAELEAARASAEAAESAVHEADRG